MPTLTARGLLARRLITMSFFLKRSQLRAMKIPERRCRRQAVTLTDKIRGSMLTLCVRVAWAQSILANSLVEEPGFESGCSANDRRGARISLPRPLLLIRLPSSRYQRRPPAITGSAPSWLIRSPKRNATAQIVAVCSAHSDEAKRPRPADHRSAFHGLVWFETSDSLVSTSARPTAASLLSPSSHNTRMCCCNEMKQAWTLRATTWLFLRPVLEPRADPP